MQPLVSTEWLAAAMASAPGSRDLIVFDATMYLPNENRIGREEFLRAHIPGARFFDIDAIADDETDLPHMLPTPGRFSQLIGRLGVSNESRVVFYDQKGLSSAARGWWMMGVFGHDQAAVLDGGLPKWRAEGRPLEAGEPPPPAPQHFRADWRASRVRGIGDLLANVRTGAELVLDARAAGRFDGSVPEPRPGMRSGHIPGAANVPYTELLNPDFTFRPPEALHARFAAAGADGTHPVVTSCGSGVTATILTLGLTLAGLAPGAVYDGSWTEWGGRADTPIER
ncbi:MAG TPA: 3-mercaptopyruvate sulfurtransferase [Acetobacteraceae bacterium]|nr:3-mercaptopyruvate sulfurtransferase [Acetobacteraceae bacterium]